MDEPRHLAEPAKTAGSERSQPGTEPPRADLPSPTPGEAAKPPRLLSLDALRGLTILIMLLVNNVALDTATPVQLTHAPWNGGVRGADFVFPWFLYCVGVAIPFSMASARRRKVPAWRTDLRILQRGLALVAIGMLLESSFAKRPVFSLGVLQIIGLAYVVGALLYDLSPTRRLLIAALHLTVYWAALKYLPVPGGHVGVFEESRNFVRHINQTYLAPVGLSGLPSVIPTSALVLLATLVGDALRAKDRDPRWRVGVLMAGGLICTLAGMAWDRSLGYNKAVWTPSYILLMAGTATMVLAGLYAFIDILGWRRPAYPLVVLGSNAIVAYVAPILVKVWILGEWRVWSKSGLVPVQQAILAWCTTHAGKVAGGWLYTIGFIVIWWLVLWLLYRRKVFLRV